jgi:predicted nucleotidyltransferase
MARFQAQSYPGTPEHQSLLRAIAEAYVNDERVLAFAVFGSLGRGTWDAYSDLDLDVVLDDGVTLDAMEEVRRLCRLIGQEIAVLVPDRADAADVVLATGMELSIRYHPLASTSPNIVDSLVVLAGRINHEMIVSAGFANRRPREPDVAYLVGACVRHVVTTDAKLRRGSFWLTVLVLNQARERLFELYAATHGGRRAYHAIDSIDDSALQTRIRRTLPGDDLPSLQLALLALIDLLEHDLEDLSAGQAHLTNAQRQLLAQIRERQAGLSL